MESKKMKYSYQSKMVNTQSRRIRGNLLHPSANAQGVNESPPKLKGVGFRKVRVEVITHYGMLDVIKGYVKENDLDFNSSGFLKIYNEPKTKSGFTMIKVTSVLSIYAEGEQQ